MYEKDEVLEKERAHQAQRGFAGQAQCNMTTEPVAPSLRDRLYASKSRAIEADMNRSQPVMKHVGLINQFLELLDRHPELARFVELGEQIGIFISVGI